MWEINILSKSAGFVVLCGFYCRMVVTEAKETKKMKIRVITSHMNTSTICQRVVEADSFDEAKEIVKSSLMSYSNYNKYAIKTIKAELIK